uniref:Uncharacterized protein n=1 Tax=Vespula pensylvanica TaxID=30213 RepID=A0A834NQE9_VESPE|nr:hypothetical protein H0235_012175 [Vespula pensylvanica]
MAHRDSPPSQQDRISLNSRHFTDQLFNEEIDIRKDPEKKDTIYLLGLRHDGGLAEAKCQVDERSTMKRIKVPSLAWTLVLDNSQHPSQHLFFSSYMDSNPREKIMLNDDVSSEKSKGRAAVGSSSIKIQDAARWMRKDTEYTRRMGYEGECEKN